MKKLQLDQLDLNAIDNLEMSTIEGGKWWNPITFILEYLGGILVDSSIADFKSRPGNAKASMTDRIAKMGPY